MTLAVLSDPEQTTDRNTGPMPMYPRFGLDDRNDLENLGVDLFTAR